MKISSGDTERKTESVSSCPKLVRSAPNHGDTVAVVLEDPGTIMIGENFCWSTLKLSDDVFDVNFFPGFNSDIPETKTMIVSSRNRPIQLLRCGDGSVLSAYTAYSFTEEIVHPISLKFEPSTCATIIGGFPSSTVRVWDVQRPGRQVRDLVFATRQDTADQSIKGIVSAVNYWNSDTILAGTYSKNFGMFDIRDKDKGIMFGDRGRMGGIVQIESIPSRHQIITNHRNERESIRVWDVRKPELPVTLLKRNFSNHQRSSLGVFREKYILSGNIEGQLNVFDLDSSDRQPITCLEVSRGNPAVGVDVNDSGRIVVASGSRKFATVSDSSDESETDTRDDNFSIQFFSIS